MRVEPKLQSFTLAPKGSTFLPSITLLRPQSKCLCLLPCETCSRSHPSRKFISIYSPIKTLKSLKYYGRYLPYQEYSQASDIVCCFYGDVLYRWRESGKNKQATAERWFGDVMASGGASFTRPVVLRECNILQSFI